ncbi:MAG: hypothetical protein ACJA0Q_000073 [Saprospiraceae bacterium]|jgi:hypothetical protein
MRFHLFILVGLIVISSCIKDDFVDDFVEPEIRVTLKVGCLAIDSLFQGVALYLNNVGDKEEVSVVWSSSNVAVALVGESTGLIKGVGIGSSSIYAKYINDGIEKMDSFLIDVSATVTGCNVVGEKSGTVATTSSYPLSGSYTLKTQGSDLLLTLGTDYTADNSLPGLYIYLSNNNQSTSGGLEIGPVTVFSGIHSYVIANTGINDFAYILYFCKPFNVKVGDGVISN